MVIDLKTLYGAEAAEQQKRYEELSANFAEEFGDANALSYFSAPGRTEVGGNHTDHNNGKVLAASINLDTIALAAPAVGSVICEKSEGHEMNKVDISDLDAVAVFHVDDAVRQENKRRLRQVHHGRIVVANFRKPARAANDNNQRNRHIHDKQR